LGIEGKAHGQEGAAQLSAAFETNEWTFIKIRAGAGADTRFSVCVSRNPDPDNLKIQPPSGSQTATGGSLRQPALAG
jgi:hypothetical protein